MKMLRALLVSALALGINAAAVAQDKIEMKLAYYVGDQHAMSQWLVKWSEVLEKRSNGRIVVKRFPGSQMGPAPQHYDFARTGQADVSWFLHGGTPGRFPLTELINLPYLVGSAETHRWHHSRVPRESNANYGSTVIVWDLVFGTWFLPREREIVDLGLQDPTYPRTFVPLMRAPFMR